MVIRPATRSDVIDLCGDSYPEGMRALVVESDGVPIGIAGILHTMPRQCFSVMKDEIRSSPRVILRVAKQLRPMMDSYDTPIYAIASEDEPTSTRFLEYVGFEYHDTTVQGEVYQWRRQQQLSP